MRLQPTHYQKIKQNLCNEIRIRRVSLRDSVGLGKLKFQKKCYNIATMTRTMKQMTAIEKRNKELNDVRAKTANVMQFRKSLVSASLEARSKVVLRNRMIVSQMRS